MIREDKKITIFGDGNQSRDFTYITNVVKANILACKSDAAVGEVYNIACAEPITINQLVQKLASLLGKDVDFVYAAPRAGDVKHSYALIEKAKRDLGYEVDKRFDDGLSETVSYFSDTSTKLYYTSAEEL